MNDRTWETTIDRTPRENLRALVRQLNIETPSKEIARLALIHIPGGGAESTVESVQEALAEEHELARAQRWLAMQDEPPTITLSEERRTLPVDTEGDVHPAEVHAVVAHRLGGREARTCENTGGVLDCAGPDCIGYRCPDCGQQRRREQAIIDELLSVAKREQMDESRVLPTPTESDADSIDDEASIGDSETADSADTTVVTEGPA
jgi:hypothetical protein